MAHLGILVLALLVVSSLLLFLPPTLRARANRRYVERHYPVGKPADFDGTFIVHWEVSRFDWNARGRQPKWGEGLFCQLEWPNGIPQQFIVNDRGRGNAFHLQFRGRVLEYGHFGHKGMCSYRVMVEEASLLEDILFGGAGEHRRSSR